ncbi:hypothetical protein ACIPSJ_01740 [Streptomyces sp. NPDC090088]|uniref:hypothetical protein n=1 Tax=Streptomyces sp. NPDC090088 TaxID=3365944 RepID=UPI0038164729
MEKATEPAAPTAPPRDSFAHAAAVAAEIVTPLFPAPFSVHIDRDWPEGWRVDAKFYSHDARGLLDLAAALDTLLTHSTVSDGIRLEAIGRVKGIEVCGCAVVTAVQAAELTGEPAPAAETAIPETIGQEPVPLGASVLAVVQAVAPTQPVSTVGLDAEDVARCVRCGCTEDHACEGGCVWVPNRQMVDLCSACATSEELQVMNYTAEVSDGGE